MLIDLLAETTENICGFKPEINEITLFLKTYEGRFLVSPEEKALEKPPKPKPQPPSFSEGKKISQDDLIPYIVKVLQKHGGRARKDQVEEEIFQMFKDLFKEQWYQETVANGVPRWKHNIAWAKERAKKKGLVKSPEESGRGYWELTTLGKGMSF